MHFINLDYIKSYFIDLNTLMGGLIECCRKPNFKKNLGFKQKLIEERY